jgi:hypothetical protein
MASSNWSPAEKSCACAYIAFLAGVFSCYADSTRFWWESPKERDHLEDQGIGGKMRSEWILGELAWGWGGFDSTVSGQGPVAGCCECGDEPSGSCATELVSIIVMNLYTFSSEVLSTV